MWPLPSGSPGNVVHVVDPTIRNLLGLPARGKMFGLRGWGHLGEGGGGAGFRSGIGFKDTHVYLQLVVVL